MQIVFPSRPNVCGDGRGSIGNVLRNDGSHFQYTHDAHGDLERTCVRGPARVVVSVREGEVIRLKTYAGPLPARDSDALDLGDVSAADAREWLLDLARHGDKSVARDAIVPLVIADAPLPWPELLALARDDRRPHEVRREAIFWLAQGASARVDPDDSDSEDDEIRKSAVFALSQQSRDAAVPMLIQVATGNSNPAVRSAALFWLGQTGDARGLDVFAKVLGLVR